MARETLLQMLEDLASKVRSLELEKRQAAIKMQALEGENREAVARIQALEREVVELARVIALACEKVEEMLKVGADDHVWQPPSVNPPATPTAPERLGDFSADPQRQPRKLLPHAFIPD